MQPQASCVKIGVIPAVGICQWGVLRRGGGGHGGCTYARLCVALCAGQGVMRAPSGGGGGRQALGATKAAGSVQAGALRQAVHGTSMRTYPCSSCHQCSWMPVVWYFSPTMMMGLAGA